MRRTCSIVIGWGYVEYGTGVDLPVAAAAATSVLAAVIASLYYYALTNQRVSRSLPLQVSFEIGTRADC